MESQAKYDLAELAERKVFIRKFKSILRIRGIFHVNKFTSGRIQPFSQFTRRHQQSKKSEVTGMASAAMLMSEEEDLNRKRVQKRFFLVPPPRRR